MSRRPKPDSAAIGTGQRLRVLCDRLKKHATKPAKRGMKCRGGVRRRDAEELRVLRQPRATGRAGSATHSLHDPGYRREPESPAILMARTLLQAGTPDPHWCTTAERRA